MVDNKTFVDAVFHSLPPGAHVYGTAFPAPPDLAPNGVWFGGPLNGRSLTRKTNYTRGDCNTFYVVSSFYPDAEGKVYRRKAQFAAAHVLTLDDIGDGASAKISWDKIKLPPSFVIETSPDNCQPGYILTEPVTDAGYFNRVVDALIEQGLASPVDPGCKGVTRYVRLPVGLNNKTKYDPSWQHVCREWHPERRYTLEQIIEAYSLVLASPKPEREYAESVVIDAEDDAYLQCFSDLGLVLSTRLRSGGAFDMVDIRCPWHEEHTDRIDVGTVYIIGEGFSCFHGHCIDRTFKDVKAKLRQSYGVDVADLDRAQKAARDRLVVKGMEKYLKALETKTLKNLNMGAS